MKINSQHIDEIVALLAVAANGNFAAAGKAIGRHPTIISKRIASLETRLGVRLVERTTRQVHLTDTGKRLADKYRVATDLIEEAQEEATENANNLSGRLKLAFPATMGRLWLAPKIPEFMVKYPNLELDINYSDNYVDLIEGGFDAAIRIGDLTDSRLVARKLTSHKRILVASPNYLQQYGTPLEPDQLLEHNCIGNPSLQSYPIWRLSDGQQLAMVRTNGTLVTNDSIAMLEAARAGIGILGAGEWLVAQDIHTGTLVQLMPQWHFDSDGGIYLVRASRHYVSARTDAFGEWISQLFQPVPWK
ncbi:LysR family transcriptional regulator [Aeromonas bivalvium]|uniref:LysR family transcriptional regulator n=1 Tax=Aeromonas bivalvium TaxID=440079 RepID=A0ABW9GVS6_9GAMM